MNDTPLYEIARALERAVGKYEERTEVLKGFLGIATAVLIFLVMLATVKVFGA